MVAAVLALPAYQVAKGDKANDDSSKGDVRGRDVVADRVWRDAELVAGVVGDWRDSRPRPDVVPTPGDSPGATATPVYAVVEPDPPPYSDIEQAICSAGWPDCAKALRVARCESGPDYWAGVGYYHVGTFQISLAYHSVRFEARGWDIYVDGTDPYRNSVVAFEIWAEQGWVGPWPTCGWE